MGHTIWVSDPGDEIDAISVEINHLERDLATSERADSEGRVCDRDRWLASLARRRQRLHDLEQARQDLLAREEASAELAETWRPEDAA